MSSVQPAAPQSKPWTFLYSCLSKSPAPLQLPVLDTIIFSTTSALRPLHWVYTDQEHYVRRKNISKLSLDDIIKSCVQSLAPPTSSLFSKGKLGDRKVCFLITPQGRKLVSLLQLWNVKMRSEEEWVEGVQVCNVAGRPFDEWVYFQTWTDKQGSSAVTKRLLEAYYTEELTSTEEELNKRVEETTNTVVQVLETTHSPVLHLRLSYLVERGTSYSDARMPWLLFAEECLMSPAPPSVPREPDPVSEPELPQLQCSELRSTVSVLTAKQDPKLAVVTLSPEHFPQVGPRAKPSPDTRPSPNRNKRTTQRPSLSRPQTRGGSTSHSCVLPSAPDLDSADFTVLPADSSSLSMLVSPHVEIRTNQVSEQAEVSLQAILQREQSKTLSPRVKIGHRDVGTPAIEENAADNHPGDALPTVVESGRKRPASRAESPDVK